MIQKIKNILLAITLPLALGAPVILAPAVAHADVGGFQTCGNINNALGQGVNTATGAGASATCGDAADQTGAGDLPTLARKIVNLLSVIVGIVAVVMIIVGGFRYITSGGESSNVSGAKNTLIYAIVGLVIVALAQFIVHFVLTSVTS